MRSACEALSQYAIAELKVAPVSDLAWTTVMVCEMSSSLKGTHPVQVPRSVVPHLYEKLAKIDWGAPSSETDPDAWAQFYTSVRTVRSGARLCLD